MQHSSDGQTEGVVHYSQPIHLGLGSVALPLRSLVIQYLKIRKLLN